MENRMSNLLVLEDVLQTKGLAQRFNSKSPKDIRWTSEKEFVKSQLMSNPKLLECTEDSVLSSFYQGASMGLSFSPTLQHIYLIPYKYYPIKSDRNQWQMMAYASPSYRGLVHLATTTGKIKFMRADVVYKGDIFTYNGAADKPLYQSKNMENRVMSKATAVFVHAITDDGFHLCEVMTKQQVMAIKSKSKQKDSLMWTTFEEEGWKKSVIRRMYKTLPSPSPLMTASISVLNDHEGLLKGKEAVEETEVQYISLDQQTEITDHLDDILPDSIDKDEFYARFLSSVGCAEIEKIPCKLYESCIQKLRSIKGQKEKNSES